MKLQKTSTIQSICYSTTVRIIIWAIVITAMLYRMWDIRLELISLETFRQFYHATEFLINFEGGFVRRGLVGELLLKLCIWTGTPPWGWIVGVCMVAYLSVTGFFIYAFRRHKYCLWIIFSTLLCGSLAELIRKDYLCFAILIGLTYMIANADGSRLRMTGGALLAILGIFVHEAFIFYGVPVLALFLLKEKQHRIFSLLLIVTIIAVFGLMCIFKGDRHIAESIISAWNQVIPSTPLKFDIQNSIGALTLDTSTVMHTHQIMNFNHWRFGVIYGIMFQLLTLTVCYYFITNFLYVFKGRSDFNEADRNRIGALFLILTVCLLPMLLALSCDLARIYQYLCVSCFIAFLILPREQLDTILGQRYLAAVGVINKSLTRIVKPSPLLIIFILLFFGIPVMFPKVIYMLSNSLAYGCYKFINVLIAG